MTIMSKNFVQIQHERIRLSTIKRYAPYKDLYLSVSFTSSRQKVDQIMFKYDTERERDLALDILDQVMA